MKIDFPYKRFEQIEPAEIPDANLMGIFEPRALGEGKEPRAVLERGFAYPIGTPRLRELARAEDRVLVLIDDYTRGTPIPRVLPHVLEELEAAGVKDRQITLLTAQGTHREMTKAELREKLGPFFGRFPVHQHRWLDQSSLHRFGTLADGTPVTANKLLAEHDLVLGIVSIAPHRIKGFSGGAKIAFPGVAGPEVQSKTQWEGARRMSETVMGIPENPMRHQMEEAAQLVGLRYVVNIVSDAKKNLTGCFVGDPVAVHREGCRLSRAINAVVLPERADIVLVDSHPADYDFWQSAKGYYSGTMAVKRGGSLILVAPNPEGVAGTTRTYWGSATAPTRRSGCWSRQAGWTTWSGVGPGRQLPDHGGARLPHGLARRHDRGEAAAEHPACPDGAGRAGDGPRQARQAGRASLSSAREATSCRSSGASRNRRRGHRPGGRCPRGRRCPCRGDGRRSAMFDDLTDGVADAPFGEVRDEIGPAQDTDQLPPGVDHQEAAETPAAEPLDGDIQSGVRGDRHHVPGHQLLHGRLVRSVSCSARASTTSRSVSTPTGWPSSTTGTTPQLASRKIRTASRAVLAGEHVRGSAVMTSATVSIGLTRSDGETSGIGSGCDRVGESQGWGCACDFDDLISAVGSASPASSAGAGSMPGRAQRGALRQAGPLLSRPAARRADPGRPRRAAARVR